MSALTELESEADKITSVSPGRASCRVRSYCLATLAKVFGPVFGGIGRGETPQTAPRARHSRSDSATIRSDALGRKRVIANAVANRRLAQ
jgi:hypothetical protein